MCNSSWFINKMHSRISDLEYIPSRLASYRWVHRSKWNTINQIRSIKRRWPLLQSEQDQLDFLVSLAKSLSFPCNTKRTNRFLLVSKCTCSTIPSRKDRKDQPSPSSMRLKIEELLQMHWHWLASTLHLRWLHHIHPHKHQAIQAFCSVMYSGWQHWFPSS